MHLGFVKKRKDVVLKEVQKEENSKDQDETESERISTPAAEEVSDQKVEKDVKPQIVKNPYAIEDE